MKKIKSIHFVGIKGVGLTSLALITKEAKINVSGSDITDEFITDAILKKAGIQVYSGFSSVHVGSVDLVITTGAHGGFDNEEVKTARAKHIPVMTHGEALGAFMQGEILGRSFRGISVTGCHGKTTTSAMVATLLKSAHLDPSFAIGTGFIPSLGNPGHLGSGTYFVAEADEYATEPVYDKTPKFLWQHPQVAVFTNIELDHPDLYPSIKAIAEAYLRFAQKIEPGGALIANGDDPLIHAMLGNYAGRVVRFGYSGANDFILKRVTVSGEQTFFWVDAKSAHLGEFALKVSGEHNALNALATLAVGMEIGLSVGQVRAGLSEFQGTERRFQYVGRLASGALLFDDYAHHPTEIIKTLRACRQRFPKMKIVCIFQPHTYSRTKMFFNEFAHAFSDADTVILAPIYPSLREEPDETVSSRMLSISMNTFRKNVLFLPTPDSVVEYIDEQAFGQDTVVITMGAGDIYKINSKVKIEKSKVIKQ